MVSSGSPAQRLALKELDATIRDLHRRKWGKEKRRGKERDREPRRRSRRFIYAVERRLTENLSETRLVSTSACRQIEG